LVFIAAGVIFLYSGNVYAKDVSLKKAVIAKSGLNVRKTADASGQKVGLIPYNETVEITETNPAEVSVAGKTGHWVKVNWKNINGWAFDAFLGDSVESPLFKHFVDIDIEVRVKGDYMCTMRKDSGKDKVFGECGNNEVSVEPLDKPAWVSGNSVMFEFHESEFSESESYDESETFTTNYECAIDGNKIMETKAGETLTIEAACKKIK